MSGQKSKFIQKFDCLHCGNTIEDRVERKYCTRSCAATANNSLFPKRTKTERICIICGIFFTTRRYETNRCVDCKGRKLAAILTRTKSESTEQNIRGQARRVMRDALKQCSVCAYSIYVEVCHIKAIKDFPPTALLTEINTLSNLVFLCPNHHKELDLGLIILQPDCVDN